MSVAGLLALTAVGAAACGGSGSDSAAAGGGEGGGEVVVGAAWPLSGPFAFDGKATLEGAKAAVQDINAAGGIKALGGAKLKIESADAGGTPETATSAVQRLLSKKPVAVAGSFTSTLALPASEVTERAGVPYVTEGFNDDITGRGFKYVFDFAPPASKITELFLSSAKRSLSDAGIKMERVAVIGDNSPAAVPLQQALEKAVKADGRALAVKTQWAPPLQDVAAIANKVAAAKPDAIFMIAYTFNDVSQLSSELRARGVDAPIIQNGGQALLPQWRKVGAKAVKGLSSFVITFPLKQSVDVSADLAKRTKVPFVGQDELDGYFAMHLIAAGLEKAGKADPEALRAALADIELTEGAAVDVMPTKTIKFDETGRITPPFGVLAQWQEKDGELTPCTIFPVEYATCSPAWK
jgi:branched-chain amino acid transport system substrate-binding protein